MRFHLREKIEPKYGELLTKKFFAWWPIKIGNEIRWLENVKVAYKYVVHHIFTHHDEYFEGQWEKISFQDEIDDESVAHAFIPDKDSPQTSVRRFFR